MCSRPLKFPALPSDTPTSIAFLNHQQFLISLLSIINFNMPGKLALYSGIIKTNLDAGTRYCFSNASMEGPRSQTCLFSSDRRKTPSDFSERKSLYMAATRNVILSGLFVPEITVIIHNKNKYSINQILCYRCTLFVIYHINVFTFTFQPVGFTGIFF